jgi:NAD+ synthase (glutamine-hydrolysing)
MAEATQIRLALAQIDPTVGDIEGNVRLISESIQRARDGGAQLVILPELCLSGYPPEDLLLRRDFLEAVRQGLATIAAEVEGLVALVGFPERVDRPADELEHFDPLIDPPPPPANK